MSYPASQIISIQTRIRPAGLGTANFASAMLFSPNAENPVGSTADTYRTYFSLTALAVDFPATTETYKAAARWLGGTPATTQIFVWLTATADATFAITLGKARNKVWWYWTMVTAAIYAVPATMTVIADWCEANGSMLINNQTGAAATAIRTNATTNIAKTFTLAGYRHAFTPSHATDAYAGNALAKHFAAVNYSADLSTITGEFKKSPGVTAEDLDGTSYANMMLDTVRSVFYSVVDNQGSTDAGRWLNTKTHSTYGEYIDDVVNLDAMVNSLTTALYNTLTGVPTKLQQTPVGQAVLLGTCRQVCQQYVDNGYLGPRNYIDPDDGITKYTIGYVILTKPEDILNLSDSDRDARKSAPIRLRIFRAGAIHHVDVSIDVF